MEPSFASVVVIDPKFQAIAGCFVAEITANAHISALKMKVQEKCKDFCRLDIAAVSVRKTKGETII